MSSAAWAAATSVDLELVIAVDVSASMDADEFRLQRSGYEQAISHPDFVRAVAAGFHGRIALTYVEWSGDRIQRVIVPWRVIDGPEGAQAFSDLLKQSPPLAVGRGTSMSSAVEFAAVLFDRNGVEGVRHVVDISGDGPNNYGRPIAEARDAAVAAGIVINGLPITLRPSPTVPDIVRYYEDCVIGGPGSFAYPVRSAYGFIPAIRQKLILEVAGLQPGRLIRTVAEPVDCLAGERLRERFADPYFPGLDN